MRVSGLSPVPLPCLAACHRTHIRVTPGARVVWLGRPDEMGMKRPLSLTCRLTSKTTYEYDFIPQYSTSHDTKKPSVAYLTIKINIYIIIKIKALKVYTYIYGSTFLIIILGHT